MHYVYILHSEKFDKYYVGQTSDVTARLYRHNSGYEGFTKPYRPWKAILILEKETPGEAVILERKLKNLSRQRLKQFIEKYSKKDVEVVSRDDSK